MDKGAHIGITQEISATAAQMYLYTMIDRAADTTSISHGMCVTANLSSCHHCDTITLQPPIIGPCCECWSSVKVDTGDPMFLQFVWWFTSRTASYML